MVGAGLKNGWLLSLLAFIQCQFSYLGLYGRYGDWFVRRENFTSNVYHYVITNVDDVLNITVHFVARYPTFFILQPHHTL